MIYSVKTRTKKVYTPTEKKNEGGGGGGSPPTPPINCRYDYYRSQPESKSRHVFLDQKRKSEEKLTRAIFFFLKNRLPKVPCSIRPTPRRLTPNPLLYFITTKLNRLHHCTTPPRPPRTPLSPSLPPPKPYTWCQVHGNPSAARNGHDVKKSACTRRLSGPQSSVDHRYHL